MKLSTIRAQIIENLNVDGNLDMTLELGYRISFLADYLRNSGQTAYVLGVSGGVDSTTAALLAQRAIEYNNHHYNYLCKFIAVRLPYGVQADEADALRALDVINPDQVITVNIKPAVDAMFDAIYPPEEGESIYTAEMDFTKGNIKARQRMVAQYAIAGRNKGLVIGTDHAAEAVMGFFTKFGDGGSDVNPLDGLTKQQVRTLAVLLGVPASLANKPPTADLEDLDPGKLDESAYGVTYEEIGAFLTGKPIPQSVEDVIVAQYLKTQHKRELPATPN